MLLLIYLFIYLVSIEALFARNNKRLDPAIARVLMDHFPTQVIYYLGVSNFEEVHRYYLMASRYPKSTTKRALGMEGYQLNGPFHGNENLIICFTEDCQPKLLKLLQGEDESRRAETLYTMLKDRGGHEFVTDFEFRTNGEIHCAIMPIYPSTLDSLSLNTMRRQPVEKLISNIGDALDWMHSFGYCHMDIKPRNIAIKDNGTFVLIDLGSMCEIGQPTDSTTRYLPSEVGFHGDRCVANPKIDWWMLAVTVVRKLSGHELEDRLSKESIKAYLETNNFWARFESNV
jgi:serine/threonine protein kinase